MVRKEAKHYKALYFDLCVKNLQKHFSGTNPNGAYRKIRNYLVNRNFSHEQYSGYHSMYRTTDLEIFDLIRSMSDEFPWLQQCLNHFEVTNVSTNHDLMNLFEQSVMEPDVMK